jgi:uncharacterized protein
MKVEVHSIPSRGLEIAIQEKASQFPALKELTDNGECDFIAPVSVELNLTPMRDFIRVEGAIACVIRQSCVRCLEDFEHRLQSGFTLNFSKDIPKDLHQKSKDGIELTAQQIGIVYYEGDEIDFTHAIEEQVVLAIPYKPICRQKCMGLCSQCGQDLNKGQCQCCPKESNSPFAALKALTPQLHKKEG